VEPERLAYCGPPPAPAELAARWNLDPALLAAGAVCALLYILAARARGTGRAERRAFGGGLAVALLAWVSPLCALGVALFSARVAQHMVLAVVAAPLLALGWPARRASLRGGALRSAPAACATFAAASWLWHAPAPYDATLRSDLAYWAMHLSLLGSAVWLWRELLRPGARAQLGGIALAAATSVQMSLLGALLTFAPAPLFESHLLTTAGWGLSPLEDQQLGGLLLWVPGCSAFLLVAVGSFAVWLRTQGELAGGANL
jgi:putative membrane protein